MHPIYRVPLEYTVDMAISNNGKIGDEKLLPIMTAHFCETLPD
jgi:hypothetical protein